ncbi:MULTISPECIES: glutamyl-tRNA reductase [Vagococcus]|uniref:Glutamyl-tRNA reductase n=1 Tax=Vagococcus fluvialis bH819 TaxID=1255619 RepID=A0A1X6WPI1_9ENTE|nr:MULTISPECIES: glutamyl-tRNA reductase [Vagococcus]SLM86243.1 Glutamyl-tRNA reductase [Vagococcus fluvialis bH819]HCM89667.1 glutamyl-tRNA reductase [Vagococcus sp.]
MHILYVGLTYKNTPVRLRERATFLNQDIQSANQQLFRTKSILENVIISTCNRTELYVVVDQLHTGKYYTKHFLADFFNLPVEELENYLTFKEDHEALVHAFRLGCGLDSAVLGETQILGQLKTSFLESQKSGTTGTIFNKLFNEMICFSKKMHSSYKFNETSASLSQSALQIANEEYHDLSDKHLFVIGAGQMSELVIKNLQNFDLKKISIFNRTLENAKKLSQFSQVEMNYYPLEELTEKLEQADLVISAISTPQTLITKTMLHEAELSKKILLFDLGLPRNINPHCQLVEHVTLYNVDSIGERINQGAKKRQELMIKVAKEVDVSVADFEEWEKQLGIIPVITELRIKTLEAEESALKSLQSKLPDLSEREVKIIRKHMKSIVNQSLRTPIREIKELSTEENAVYDIQLFKRIFGIELEKEN